MELLTHLNFIPEKPLRKRFMQTHQKKKYWLQRINLRANFAGTEQELLRFQILDYNRKLKRVIWVTERDVD